MAGAAGMQPGSAEPDWQLLAEIAERCPLVDRTWQADIGCVVCTCNQWVFGELAPLLRRAMPKTWTVDDSALIPSSLRLIVERAGGLRQDQHLHGRAIGDGHLWALVWPWKDQVTVTLKLGLERTVSAESLVWTEQLRGAFGLSPG